MVSDFFSCVIFARRGNRPYDGPVHSNVRGDSRSEVSRSEDSSLKFPGVKFPRLKFPRLKFPRLD